MNITEVQGRAGPGAGGGSICVFTFADTASASCINVCQKDGCMG